MRTKKEPTQEEIDKGRASVKSIAGTLFDYPQWMRLLKGRNAPYEDYIDTMADYADELKGMSDDERYEATIPSHLADKLGIKRPKFNTWIRQMYDDIYTVNGEHPEYFVDEGEYRCEVYMTHPVYSYPLVFTIGLPVIPRIGECINIDFVSPYIDYGPFRIKDLSYYYEAKQLTIYMTCDMSFQKNIYRDFLYDKAIFLRDIEYSDFKVDDYALDDFLRKYGKGDNWAKALSDAERRQKERRRRYASHD